MLPIRDSTQHCGAPPLTLAESISLSRDDGHRLAGRGRSCCTTRSRPARGMPWPRGGPRDTPHPSRRRFCATLRERPMHKRITATRHTTRVHAPSCTAHPLTPARFSTTPVAAPGALAAHATGPRVLAASHTPSPHPSRVGQTRRKPGTLQPPSGPTQTHARQAGPSLIAFPPTTHASPLTHASP